MAAERQTRKGFAGRDFGGPEAYDAAFFTGMSRRTGRPPEFLREWYFGRYMPAMVRVLGRCYRARHGTTELFAALTRAGLPFAVYSDYPLVDERLAALSLDPALCGLRFGPGGFGAQKPAARPFREIAAALGRSPDTVLVAGDRDDTDGAGAAAAGMRFVKIGSAGDWDNLVTQMLH
jgi:FMN phosphatase YigB (HAD superfamily)